MKKPRVMPDYVSCFFFDEDIPMLRLAGSTGIENTFLEQSASIDGEFNESCWQNAALVENFVNHLEPHEPQQRTSLLMFHNGQSLFFGFTCYDSDASPTKMQAETKYDGSLWVNDCVEIFIGSTENPHLFQQFIVNWRGAGFDSFEAFGRVGIKPSRWNVCWRRAVQLKDDSWQVEVEIPFSASISRARRMS